MPQLCSRFDRGLEKDDPFLGLGLSRIEAEVLHQIAGIIHRKAFAEPGFPVHVAFPHPTLLRGIILFVFRFASSYDSCHNRWERLMFKPEGRISTEAGSGGDTSGAISGQEVSRADEAVSGQQT